MNPVPNPPEPSARRERGLDEELMLEVVSEDPSPDRIRDLVRRGANPNSAAITGENNLLADAITTIPHGLPIAIVKMLVDLGADVNADPGGEGCRPLFQACLAGIPDLVAFLLAKGADPNFFIEKHETLLDWVSFDRYFHAEVEALATDSDRYMVRAYGEIIPMLKAAGARSASEDGSIPPKP